MTYVALPSYQGHHASSTTQVLWECSSHPETEKTLTKTNTKKTPADKVHDQTLAPKQSLQEGWLKKVLPHGRKTIPINKISGWD